MKIIKAKIHQILLKPQAPRKGLHFTGEMDTGTLILREPKKR